MKKKIFLFLFFLAFLKLEAQTWSLVWSDEFTATAIDSSNWNFETGGGGWGNNELENYTNRPDNAIIENGSLHIIAKKENYGGSNYTSARMTTKTKRNLTYGRVEARIKMMAKKGLWPAFWMLGENISSVGWPNCGEIDIMEHVNTDADIHGTIHWDNNGHAQYGGAKSCTVTDYHVYSIEWDSTTIRWFLDGTEYFNANIANNINSTNEFHNPFFVILNVAVGGTWPGNPDGTTIFPDTMSVDYVRFYQLKTIPPAPVITANGSLTLCQGDSVLLTSSTATSYLWSTGATTQSIVVKTSGTYTVSITDNNGGTNVSDPIVVTVKPSPAKPTITESGGGGLPGGPPALLTSSATTGNQWFVDGNLISGANQQDFSPHSGGYHTVRVTGNNGCTAISDSLQWWAKPSTPPPVITSSGSLTICQGDSVILTCSSANSYLWSNSETTQSIIVKTSGTYTVSIDGGSAVSDSVVVVVNALPATPTISQLVNTLTSSSATGNQWFIGGSQISNANQHNYVASQDGDYTVKVTNNNCSATSAPYSFSVTPVVVVIPSTPVITANGSLTLCQGDSVTLTCSSAISYLWSTTETTQSVIVKSNGTYTVSIDGGAAVSDSTAVIVNTLPIVGIIVDPSAASICEGESVTLTGTGATTYTWSGGVTNGVAFVPTVLGATTYTVTGTSNSCVNTATQAITVSTCTVGVGMQEVSTSVQEIIIYPNPNSGLFKIETKNSILSQLKIVNVLGEIIYESADQNLEFNLTSQSKGTYFVEVSTQDKIVHKKLIIQ